MGVQDQGQQWTDQPFGSNHFLQNLMCQQIDAVFNGLAALIETERIKLKSMIVPMASPVVAEPSSSRVDQGANRAQSDRPGAQEADIGQQVLQFAAAGQNPAGIANQLGISLAEVNLAMKMQASRNPQAGRKLEAVA